MQAHTPTIFLVTITVSFSLAAAIAAVSYRRKNGLMPWAFGIALHGLAYLLFTLRGEISDFLSIVVANTAIAFMFALFTEGMRNFAGPRPRKWYVWVPVGVIALGFSLLLDDIYARIILSSLVYLFQSVLLAYFGYRCRSGFDGRGQYAVVTGSLLFAVVILMRLVAAMDGAFTLSSITTSSPIQTLTFLISIVSTLLVVIGAMLMTWERDEQLIKESETRMRTLFESTSDAVMLLDERGFFDCNSATLAMFGCPSKAVFATKRPSDLSPPLQPGGIASSTLAEEQIAKARREASNRFEWVHKRLDNDLSFPAEVLLNAMEMNGRHVLQAVVRDISERKRLQEELEHQAHLDYLTGLDNRGYFMHQAEIEVARALRYTKHLSLLMMDVDNFKRFNDTHGHKTGDRVLEALAGTCLDTLREVDVIGRIGGEEFAVILPETSTEEATDVAERLRANIAETQVATDDGATLGFTVSIGVASLSADNESLDALMGAADKALYLAKNAGRNKVMLNPGNAPR